jgi:cytochrome b subunit of formate dehydrogenase
MLGYFVACLVAAYALLRHAVHRLNGPAATPSAGATVLLTLSVGLGSTLLFLGSRAYVYHEAILCGAAFSLWSAWFALRWLSNPDSQAWLGAFVCGLFAVHARPTSGLFALTLLGCAAVAVAIERRTLRRPALAAALAVVGMLSFNGVSYWKFRTFDGSPFKYSVQYDAQRLARFDGKNFHLSNIPFNADAYFLNPRCWLQREFPWIMLERPRREDFPKARMDHIEHTLGVPFAMPALFTLATAGSILAALGATSLRRDLLVLWASVTPMASAMLAIVVVSHRYTTDFVPFLVCAAACGLAASENLSARWRLVVRASTAVLAGLAAVVTVLISIWFQGAFVWGAPESAKGNYQRMQHFTNELFHVAPPRP